MVVVVSVLVVMEEVGVDVDGVVVVDDGDGEEGIVSVQPRRF